MKIIMIALAFCFCSSGCVKLTEDIQQERIPRPTIDVGEITPPDWDYTEGNISKIGSEVEDTK